MKKVWLERGAHNKREDGVCAQEFAAYLAGEGHTARPKCVARPLNTMMILINDALDDEDRQCLKPYVVRTLGTRDDGQDTERRRRVKQWFASIGHPVGEMTTSGWFIYGLSWESIAARKLYLKTHPEECFVLIESILDPAGIHDVKVDAETLEPACA